MGLLPARRSVKEVPYPRGKKSVDWEVREPSRRRLRSWVLRKSSGAMGIVGFLRQMAETVLDSLF